jgi:hypothetical protein
MTNKEHLIKYGNNITVDHIDGSGRYSNKPNNIIKNLWTLCLSCHGRRDSLRGWITRKNKQYSYDIIKTYHLEGV